MGWAQSCREYVLCAKNKQWLLVKPTLVVMSGLSQLWLGPKVTWMSFALVDFPVYAAQVALWSRSRRFSPWSCGLSCSVFVQVLASVLGVWAVDLFTTYLLPGCYFRIPFPTSHLFFFFFSFFIFNQVKIGLSTSAQMWIFHWLMPNLSHAIFPK